MTTPARFTIFMRNQHFVNTDPQRRCYDGCHFSGEFRWGAWESLGTVPADKVDDKLKFWRELNDYAVSQRGKGARSEFQALPEGVQP